MQTTDFCRQRPQTRCTCQRKWCRSTEMLEHPMSRNTTYNVLSMLKYHTRKNKNCASLFSATMYADTYTHSQWALCIFVGPLPEVTSPNKFYLLLLSHSYQCPLGVTFNIPKTLPENLCKYLCCSLITLCHTKMFQAGDFITALHCMHAVFPIAKLSVRLSVRPSHAWIVTKRTKVLPTFLYHMKGKFI